MLTQTKFLMMLTLLVLLFTSCSPAQVSEQVYIPTVDPDAPPLIIDTDMAADDWLAILYLLQRRDVRVLAITVSGTGEAHCKAGVENALGLVALAGHEPLPVACGREEPLQGSHVFPLTWRTAVDLMLGISLPKGENPAGETDALTLLKSILAETSEKVSILTLGPLTNLGELFLNEGNFQEEISRIVIMGGAVHVSGNILSEEINNNSAEWNIYVDPTAAQIVFESGLPITLVPLDATNQVSVTQSFYKRLEKEKQSAETDFVYEVISRNKGMISSGTYYFWDPLAAVLLVEKSLGQYESLPLCVVEEEGPLSGQTLVEEGCPLVEAAIFADQAGFEDNFIEVLNYP